MSILLGFGFALAAFPFIVAIVFPPQVAQRRQRMLIDELKQLFAADIPSVRAWGGEQGIRNAVEDYYSRTRILWPALFLAGLYALGFQCSFSYLASMVGSGDPGPFTADFAKKLGPAVLTFLGVYAFNMGTAVRRMFLDDIGETMFWSALNRLVLSEALTIAICAGGPNADLQLQGMMGYFAVGFLANPLLARMLELVSTAAKLSTSLTSAEISVRAVQGINIWKEYRLEEEGVDSAENLCTSDVIGLAIKTHFSLRTIIDWVDQAALIVRLRDRSGKLSQAGIAVSAIEFAWRSPLNGGDSRANGLIAQTLGMDPVVLEDTMNALFQDEQIQTLWRLWQSIGSGNFERYRPTPVPVNGTSSTSLGVLAYGSLVADPGPELTAATERKIDGLHTPFAVEFARSSSGRGGAPTLVPVDAGGSQVPASLLVLKSSVDLDTARDILWRRETNRINSGARYPKPTNPGPNTVVIEKLENFGGLKTVLYVKIAPNIAPLTGEHLAELARASLVPPLVAAKRDGVNYLLQSTTNGVNTPLTSDYVRELLRQSTSASLEELLQKQSAPATNGAKSTIR